MFICMLDADDLELALQSQLRHTFVPPPPREVSHVHVML